MSIRVRCLDGKRRGVDYFFPEGTYNFQINTLGLDENRQGVYFGYIYKVYRMWGMPAYGAFQVRMTR